MSETINTFMEFIKQEKHKKPFIVQNVIEETIAIVKPQFASRNITLNISDLCSEKIEITGYRNLIEQVLLTLLSNARDAFEEQQIENSQINIITSRNSDIVEICVEDNAGGVKEEHIEKLFNPYFTTKEPGKGTGLGLYMAKRIITEQFNGHIYYNSIKNGSCFIINININDNK
ncbi:HAMP domain-containing sensor histidine kinase [Hydrogenimonas thermophila]|nr:HAMP domain-containing sensor histidine kinase [Hydrogenimonas thermophila]WOE70728.1 HAMP domain-containing sensor histidine kinase [Hydrogenimonas thermophila]WOE73246.1 HAMP domain-containing sensor histidine kinase [Hydrogenimonas thermophila]